MRRISRKVETVHKIIHFLLFRVTHILEGKMHFICLSAFIVHHTRVVHRRIRNFGYRFVVVHMHCNSVIRIFRKCSDLILNMFLINLVHIPVLRIKIG